MGREKPTNKGSPVGSTGAGVAVQRCLTWITQVFISLPKSPQNGPSLIQTVSEKWNNVGPGHSLQQKKIVGGWEGF